MPLSAKASGVAGVLSRARRAITVARRPRGLESCACVLLRAHFREIKLVKVQGHPVTPPQDRPSGREISWSLPSCGTAL